MESGLYNIFFNNCAVLQSGDGMNECEQILSAGGAVCTMCVDGINGGIVAGVQEVIRCVSAVSLHCGHPFGNY